MSSRNFRRRTNRRRHKPAGDAPEGQSGQQAAGNAPAPDAASVPEGRADTPPRQRQPGGGSPAEQRTARSRRKSRGGRDREQARRGEEGREGRPPQEPRAVEKQAARQQERRPPERQRQPQPPRICPDCPICSRPVRELPSALTHRPTGQPAHFECILKELRDAQELSPQERLCYLGGGTFGILEFRQAGGATKFTIRKRIQYEEKDSPSEWKKGLQVSS